MIRSAVIGLVVLGACLLLATAGFGADSQGGKVSEQKSDAASSESTQKSPSAPATGEEINWQVISSGGTEGTSTNFGLNGTVGQTAVGAGSSTSYGLNHGYWQSFGCCDMRGDVDNSGGTDVGDLTYLVAYFWQGGPAPPCEDEGDVDGSGGTDVGDLTYLVAYFWQGGPAPPPC